MRQQRVEEHVEQGAEEGQARSGLRHDRHGDGEEGEEEGARECRGKVPPDWLGLERGQVEVLHYSRPILEHYRTPQFQHI